MQWNNGWNGPGRGDSGRRSDRVVAGWIAGCLSLAMLLGSASAGEIQCTSGPGNDSEAAWSPDGKRIVFQSDRTGTLGLYLLDLATKTTKPLVQGPGHAAFPAWSPDGKWIVYSRAHFTTTALHGPQDGYNLFVVAAEGGPPRRLTRGPWRDYSPTFSPDGQTIWFSSDRGSKKGSNAVSLHTIPVKGGEPSVVLEREGIDRAAVQASFSPDGRLVAYGLIAGFRDNWAIRLARADRPADALPLTDARACFYAPRWSPKEAVLACTGFEVGDAGWSVYLIDARSARRLRLDTGPGNSRGPAWSADGRRLAFENNRSGSYKLYCVDAPAFPAPPPAAATSAPSPQEVLHCSFAQRSASLQPDQSLRGNAGTIHGEPDWREGGVSFARPGAYVTIANARGFDFGAGPFAVRAAVKVPRDGKFAMICMGEYPGNRLGWQLYVGDDRRAWFNSRSPDLAYRGARSNEPLPTDRPVTLVGVRDAQGRVSLYVDGALQQLTSQDALYRYGPPVQVRIGTQLDGKAAFAGWIYDLAVYGRELSPDEVRGDSLRWFWAEASR